MKLIGISCENQKGYAHMPDFSAKFHDLFKICSDNPEEFEKYVQDNPLGFQNLYWFLQKKWL